MQSNTNKGECGGGNDKRKPAATSGGEGGPHPARGATNLCHSALCLRAALRPKAAIAACGRREGLRPLSAKSGHEDGRSPTEWRLLAPCGHAREQAED